MKLSNVFKNKNIALGGTIMALLVLVAIFCPVIAPFDPNKFNVKEMLKAPSLQHLFGTDGYGRDIFSRIVFGARISMTISVTVAVISGIIGSLLGLLSGYYKKLDRIIMCVMDGMMAIPSMMMAMAIVAMLGVGMLNLIIALTISNIPRVVRTIRATVISVKELDFIEAAKSMGASDLRILIFYIFPECISPLIVRLTMTTAFTILEEASLTFLGLGLSPTTPSWGIILSEAQTHIRLAPYFIIIPGIVVVLAVFGINILGDGLRDYLDPSLNIEK